MLTTYCYKGFKPHTTSGPLTTTVHWNAKLFATFSMFSFYMRLERLKAVTMRIIVLWDVVPCSVVEIYEHFEGFFCLHLLTGKRRQASP